MLSVSKLLVEERVNPVGVQADNPRFGWRFSPVTRWHPAANIRSLT